MEEQDNVSKRLHMRNGIASITRYLILGKAKN